MADFNSIVADVYSLTNRADLVGETAIAVKSATLKLHASENFFKDLFEVPIQFDVPGYLQQFTYRTIAPKYRALKYIRKLDSTGMTPLGFYNIITPEQIFDSYHIERLDVAYVAGDVINIKSSTSDTYALFGCYVYPTVDTPETYSSWIAIENPYAIVYEAAKAIATMLKNDIMASSFAETAAIFRAELIGSNIEAVGY